MGWYDSHLHAFQIRGEESNAPSADLAELEMRDERKAILGKLVSGEKDRFRYLYDFGDGWAHEITVEKVLPFDPAVRYPVCLTGKRACPPEDCGGAWGCARLLDVLADPAHPEYEELNEGVGEAVDPEAWELEQVNKRLALMRV